MNKLLILATAALMAGFTNEAVADTYGYDFKSLAFSSYGETADLNGVNWTLNGDGNATSLYYRPSTGQQLSLSDADSYSKEVVLSTDEIKGSIDKITVTAKSTYISTAEVVVSVNGIQYGEPMKLGNAKQDFIFPIDAEGDIRIIFTQTTPGPIYIQALEIETSDTPTGITELFETATASEYYDLTGRRLDPCHLPAGILIEKTGTATRKIINR